MPLSWNEIRSRAVEFSKRWEDETSEDAEAKAFWTEFLNVFGIDRKRVASFEEPVKKLGNKQGYIDLFWKGELLVEHKSRGKDLDKAYIQALDYFPGIKERELPKYVLVSDFARFRLYDLEDGEQHEFALRDLHKNIKCFGFIAGYQTRPIQTEDPVNIKAAELMGRLHDALKDIRNKLLVDHWELYDNSATPAILLEVKKGLNHVANHRSNHRTFRCNTLTGGVSRQYSDARYCHGAGLSCAQKNDA